MKIVENRKNHNRKKYALRVPITLDADVSQNLIYVILHGVPASSPSVSRKYYTTVMCQNSVNFLTVNELKVILMVMNDKMKCNECVEIVKWSNLNVLNLIYSSWVQYTYSNQKLMTNCYEYNLLFDREMVG